MEGLKVVSDQRLPIRDVVFNTLREAILTGKLPPGERLMEKHIAEDIGVSRTPIREALRRLQMEGLVEITPRKGAVVSKISEKDIHDVLEVRSALEALAARLACVNMTGEQLAEIKKAAEDFDASYLEQDYELVAEKDQLFHDKIIRATGNEKLISILSNLRGQIYRFRVEYLKVERYRKQIATEHKELLEALSKRDSASAQEISQMHIVNQEINIIEMVGKKPGNV